MFSAASNVDIAGGSFSIREAPQAHASIVVNMPERVPVTVFRHDERVSSPEATGNIPQEVRRLTFSPSHVIYTEHLSTKGRGHPLWFPNPSLNLPPEYRAQGVSIGDVGIIKASGIFDFLFNINYPASHPINSDRPSDFQPLDPPLRARDIYEDQIFAAGSSLASSSIKRIQSGTLNGELEFESSATEGAVLAMPEATFQSDLSDLDGFYRHIGIHAESWYRYANGPGMGRRLNNGDLCLVIGCDKTTSWGIAAFSHSSEQTTSRLQFRPIASPSGDAGQCYTWIHSGTADSPRVGPDRGSILGLGPQAESEPLRNQCLFLRYLTFKLPETSWLAFKESNGVQIHMESHQSTCSGSKQSNSPNTGSSRKFGSALLHVLRSVFSASAKAKEATVEPTIAKTSLEIVAETYAASDMPSFSTYLNDYLLQFPGAKVAATRGVEWYSKYLLVDNSVNSESVSDFLRDVLSENGVCLNELGVIYFHPLPPSCVGLIDPTITSATSLGLALLDLKTAFDMVAKIGAKKDSYMSLIDRCMGLVVNICSSIEQGSPMPLDGDMRCLENTCTAVRDTVLKLSGEDTPGKFSNEDDIEQEITTVQNGLTAASALFDVGVYANSTQSQVREDLHWALRRDRQRFLVYLDYLLEDVQSKANPTMSLRSRLPSQERNEYGSLQTPKQCGGDLIFHEMQTTKVEGLPLGTHGRDLHTSQISRPISFHGVVDPTPNDHGELPPRLNRLGISLSRRFKRAECLADLSNGISSFRRAVEVPNVKKAARRKRELEARRVSDTIDEEISQERVKLRKEIAVRVLLLGQSESGKSTTLKNFRMMFAPAEWKKERNGWKTVVQLNIIHSIITILSVLQAEMNGEVLVDSEDDRSTINDTDEIEAAKVTDHHRLLMTRLAPLNGVEAELKGRLGSSSEPVQSALLPAPSFDATHPKNNFRRMKEFSVRSWGNLLEQNVRTSADSPANKSFDSITATISSCVDDMKTLWNDQAVHLALKRQQVELGDNAGFFLNDLDRVASRDYTVTDDDIVRARLRTVGIQEYQINLKQGQYRAHEWRFFDVGGCRTMRHAWLPYFDNLDAIIFLAPVSVFDQQLEEEPQVNRLEDSMVLWKTVCSSKLLANTQLILFLNKCDLLEQKLQRGVQVKKYVPSFGDRPNEAMSFVTYLRTKFKALSAQHDMVYIYSTTVTDTTATAKILYAVTRDGMIRRNIMATQLV